MALAELRRGRKSGHWIWFIFPQIRGLGHSQMSRHYAIASIEEAREYLADAVLGPRLRACTAALLGVTGKTAEEILGSIDSIKVRSSMTLFHRAGPDETVFVEVLKRYYAGVADSATDALLRSVRLVRGSGWVRAVHDLERSVPAPCQPGRVRIPVSTKVCSQKATVRPLGATGPKAPGFE